MSKSFDLGAYFQDMDLWALDYIAREFPDLPRAHHKILQLQRAVETLQRKNKDYDLKFEVLESNFQALKKKHLRFVKRHGRFVRVIHKVAGAVLES